jgi:hypothetical protein
MSVTACSAFRNIGRQLHLALSVLVIAILLSVLRKPLYISVYQAVQCAYQLNLC